MNNTLNSSFHHSIIPSLLVALLLCSSTPLLLTCCTPKVPAPESIFISENEVSELTKDGKLYSIHELVDQFMTEEGNYFDDSVRIYRKRGSGGKVPAGCYLFSIDTLPSAGEGIYIRARVETDDQGGNFYKTLVLQQVVEGQQQNIRVGIDAAAISGLYPMGQELLIRCNGLAIGRYANQIQLCSPFYNNADSKYTKHADEKVGWAPGRVDLAQFKNHSWRIGLPDSTKLQVDVISITDFFNETDFIKNRKLDGRLVRIENIHFTGEYCDYGERTDCTCGNPSLDKNANVFAPTTENNHYPQSRVIADIDGNWTLVSVSEFARMARYYLPGAGSPYDGEYQYTISKDDIVEPEGPYLTADYGGTTYFVSVPEERVAHGFHKDDVIFISDATSGAKSLIYDGSAWSEKVGILHCPEYEGSVTGVLGFYWDNASDDPKEETKWSITLCDVNDIDLQTVDGTQWNPKEYTNKNK